MATPNKQTDQPPPTPPAGSEQGKDDSRSGIWLEVAEIRYGSGKWGCQVQLKGDKERPEPVWWPVEIEPDVGEPDKKDPFGTFKRITDQVDKKRVVLVRLSCKQDGTLQCDALRFQSPELGSR